MRPRILHQVWLGAGAMPARQAAWGEALRRMNPTWEYRLWGNDDLPGMLNADLAKRLAERFTRACVLLADLLRVEVLARHGGVYLDTDVAPVRPLDLLPAGAWIVCENQTGATPPGFAGNGAIGLPRGHPFAWGLLAAFRTTFDRYRRLPERAGPLMLQEVLRRHPDVRRLHPSLGEVSGNGGHPEPLRHALLDHRYAGTWLPSRKGENAALWEANGHPPILRTIAPQQEADQ